MRHVVNLGLLLLVPLVLIGGCAGSTCVPCVRPPPCADPCAVRPEPAVEPCSTTEPPGTWPVACGSPTALGMLNQIQYLAEQALDEDIAPEVRERVVLGVERCLKPDLASASGVPVMEIRNPDPCVTLRAIYDLAVGTPLPVPDIEDEQPPPTPDVVAARAAAGSRQRWESIAEELESFPAEQ